MNRIADPIMRIAQVESQGVTLDELAPVELASLTQPVFCLHCCKVYPFGESALALDGLIYCPVVGCEGSLIDQIPVVETELEQESGKGWQRSTLSAQFEDVQPAAPLELVWSRLYTPMSADELRMALLEAQG